MNAAKAREYDQKITNLQNDSDRIHSLQQEQTLLIKESLALNNKSINELSHQLFKIKESVNYYYDATNIRISWVHAELTFTEAVTIIKMIETEHFRLTRQILHCLEETMSGKISQLIPKDRLTNDLIQTERLLREIKNSQ